MQLSPDHLAELESLAIQAATRAGEMIQSKTELDHQVLRKQSGSTLASQVVTALDLESQRLIPLLFATGIFPLPADKTLEIDPNILFATNFENDEWKKQWHGGTYGQAGWGGRPSNGLNGWSARGLFKGRKDGKTPVGFYCYHAEMKGKYGDNFLWDKDKLGMLENNRWYCIEQYAKLNTVGESNGILRSWIDGKLAFEKSQRPYAQHLETQNRKTLIPSKQLLLILLS
jgi:hypothetical protein